MAKILVVDDEKIIRESSDDPYKIFYATDINDNIITCKGKLNNIKIGDIINVVNGHRIFDDGFYDKIFEINSYTKAIDKDLAYIYKFK